MARAMKVAIVDDEADMRASISQWLALSGFDTETFASAEEALKTLGPDWPGVVVSDIKMPGMDGMAFLKRLMGMDSGLPVIMITGHGDVPMAVEAMRIGAYDFLEKPFNPDRMTELAKRATIARNYHRRHMPDQRAARTSGPAQIHRCQSCQHIHRMPFDAHAGPPVALIRDGSWQLRQSLCTQHQGLPMAEPHRSHGASRDDLTCHWEGHAQLAQCRISCGQFSCEW